MVFTLIHHSNNVKMFKTQVEWCVVSLQSCKHFDIISVVYKRED